MHHHSGVAVVSVTSRIGVLPLLSPLHKRLQLQIPVTWLVPALPFGQSVMQVEFRARAVCLWKGPTKYEE